MGNLSVLDNTGDIKTTWDKDNAEEVEAARKTFNDLKRKKYIAYSVGKGGKKDEIIHEFDENLEMMIMIPPVVGG